jgi:8-oxo-dGTP pyrophosphatase MutT (NUDIX family)
VFQSYWRLSRSLTLGVRGVVLDSQGRVLLLRHTYTPGWHFPGGGVEKGETAARALQRELVEEAGVIAEESAMELVAVYANHTFFPNDHVLLYRITQWTQGKATSRGEIEEVQFVTPASPPGETSPATRRRLAELFGDAPRDGNW